jgi:hypothetical protein
MVERRLETGRPAARARLHGEAAADTAPAVSDTGSLVVAFCPILSQREIATSARQDPDLEVQAGLDRVLPRAFWYRSVMLRY